MFCYQCEQTTKSEGCEVTGICGKEPEVASLQDHLIHGLKGLSMYAHRARALGAKDKALDIFAIEILVTTVTNVSFDPKRLDQQAVELGEMRDRARKLYQEACTKAGKKAETLSGPALWQAKSTESDRMGLVSITARKEALGDDTVGLQELALYGLKGMAAYAKHAQLLGKADDEIYAFVHEVMSALAEEHTTEEWVGLALRVGALNLKVMELLDSAHTETFGHPVPTQVRTTPVAGKAILISGHDLKDLKNLLEQTKGKGINIYTHGEMLPAHGYPELNKYDHLAGNYGGAWQDQKKEFEAFPGAILMTTNCIQQPRDNYKDRIFTCGLVAWPDVTHIDNGDFSKVIEAALAAPGFAKEEAEQKITVGFGHNAVLNVADKVIEAVKGGAIKHFFLVGGCDGAKSGRNYYTDFVRAVPDDCVVLTLACGKYRFNKMDLGDIGGIPRLLDIGQCNDAYSAVKIASALAEAFETDVNGLPLSMVLSWYEQKAVAILLTLLHLGIKNIRIGPSLPAFITEPVLKVLVENYNLQPITTPEADLKAILG